MQLAAQARKALQKVFCEKGTATNEDGENEDQVVVEDPGNKAKWRLVRWQALTMVLASLCLSHIFATTFLVRAPESSNNTSVENGTNTVLRVTIYDTFNLPYSNDTDKIFTPSMWLKITFFSGMAVGSIVFGVMADKLGRWVTMKFIVRGLIVAGLVASISKNVVVYGIARFVIGATSVMSFFVPLAQLQEMIDEKIGNNTRFRLAAALIFGYTWNFGHIVTTLTAYLVYSWHGIILALLIGLTVAVFMFTHSLDQYGNVIEEQDDTQDPTLSGFCHVFREHHLFTLNLTIHVLTWFTSGFIFYGVIINWSTISPDYDIYENFALSAVLSICSKTLAVITCLLIKQKLLPFMILQVSSGLCFIYMLVIQIKGDSEDDTGSMFTGKQGLIFMAHMGNFLIGSAWAILGPITFETFPKKYRMTCVGICSCSARFGAISGIILGGMKKIHLSYAGSGFAAGMALLTALLCRALPDMTGYNMAKTFADISKVQFTQAPQPSGNQTNAQSQVQQPA